MRGAHGSGSGGRQHISSLSHILMTLAYWTFDIPEAAQSHGSSSALPPNCSVYTEHFFLTCADVYVFSVVPGVCGPLVSLFVCPSVCLSLRLHPAKAMAAVLVKRFVYPIRMMKRPFISTLPPARRWQELYLDMPLKHTTRHETAPSEEDRRRYTYSLTNTQYSLQTHWVWAGKKTGICCCQLSLLILYSFLSLVNRVQCTSRGVKGGQRRRKVFTNSDSVLSDLFLISSTQGLIV